MSDTLNAGDQLNLGQSIFSQDGHVQLVMQQDGNLVLYQVGGTPLWNTNTVGLPVTGVVMQNDGNLVIYMPGLNGPRAVWYSNTSKPGSTLAVQNDGNLVIYHQGQAVWATGTHVNGPFVSSFSLTEKQQVIENMTSRADVAHKNGDFGLEGKLRDLVDKCASNPHVDDLDAANFEVAVNFGDWDKADAICTKTTDGPIEPEHQPPDPPDRPDQHPPDPPDRPDDGREGGE